MEPVTDYIVSGPIPKKRLLAVQYPGHVKNVPRALHTLGGLPAIAQARSSDLNFLELRYRPEDPFCHPLFGDHQETANLLLKVRRQRIGHKRKFQPEEAVPGEIAVSPPLGDQPNNEKSKENKQFKVVDHVGELPDSQVCSERIIGEKTGEGESPQPASTPSEQASCDNWKVSAGIIGRLESTYRFVGQSSMLVMYGSCGDLLEPGRADFQYVVGIANKNHMKTVTSPQPLQNGSNQAFQASPKVVVGRADLFADPEVSNGDQRSEESDDLMVLVPPLFSQHDMPDDQIPKSMDREIKQMEVEAMAAASNVQTTNKTKKRKSRARRSANSDLKFPNTVLGQGPLPIPLSIPTSDFVPEAPLQEQVRPSVLLNGHDFNKGPLTVEGPQIPEPEEIDESEVGKEEQEYARKLKPLLEKRPIWSRHALAAVLTESFPVINLAIMKRLLVRMAYLFANGPFRTLWIRKGYDPRKDPASRIYQVLDFRVPSTWGVSLNEVPKYEVISWQDLCAFRTFPVRRFSFFQLCDLEDDDLQAILKKEPDNASCSEGSGWFSRDTLEKMRDLVRLRFHALLSNSYEVPLSFPRVRDYSVGFVRNERLHYDTNALHRKEQANDKEPSGSGREEQKGGGAEKSGVAEVNVQMKFCDRDSIIEQDREEATQEGEKEQRSNNESGFTGVYEREREEQHHKTNKGNVTSFSEETVGLSERGTENVLNTEGSLETSETIKASERNNTTPFSVGRADSTYGHQKSEIEMKHSGEMKQEAVADKSFEEKREGEGEAKEGEVDTQPIKLGSESLNFDKTLERNTGGESIGLDSGDDEQGGLDDNEENDEVDNDIDDEDDDNDDDDDDEEDEEEEAEDEEGGLMDVPNTLNIRNEIPAKDFLALMGQFPFRSSENNVTNELGATKTLPFGGGYDIYEDEDEDEEEDAEDSDE